ncbi:MAG: hypothetical protein OXG65_01225 [Chloroflexi bacterium]|nr:hypothetical protein [Chloroflexota bacterium]
MSADLAAILAAVAMVGIGLAGLTVALWRDVRADIRELRASIDADRVAHEALHAAERQDRANKARKLRAAVAAIRDAAS